MAGKQLRPNIRQASKDRITSLIVVTGVGTTLVMTPGSSFDPINWSKLLFLASGAFSCIFLKTFIARRSLFGTQSILLYFFALTSLLTFILNGPNPMTFWGMQGRATGFLAYIALCALAISATHLATSDRAYRVLNAFLVTNMLILFYMILQFLDLDPVQWSRREVFATLGNINFTSALIGMMLPIYFFFLIGDKSLKLKAKLSILFVIALSTVIVFSSGSWQGFIGTLLACLMLVLARTIGKIAPKFFKVLAFLVIFLTGFSVFALSQPNWFGGFFFQTTMGYRRDYWVAGLSMIRNNLLTGIGFDQYGLFYRAERDELAATRTGIGRFSDSAHSIAIDLAVSGGIVLLAILILILVYVTNSALNSLVSNKSILKASISLAWLAYLPQFMLGINQLGVAVWAWIIMGWLIAANEKEQGTEAEKIDIQSKLRLSSTGLWLSPNSNKSLKSTETFPVPPSVILTSMIGGVVGFLLALPPFVSDAKFNSAYKLQDFVAMKEVIGEVSSNSFHLDKALELAIQRNDAQLALNLAKQSIARYPRNDFAWRVIYDLKVSPPELRDRAVAVLRDIDPYFAKEIIGKSPKQEYQLKLSDLSDLRDTSTD